MRIFFTLIILLAIQPLYAQSLRINEFSQGATGAGLGSQEWVELIVVPGASGPVGPNNCGVFTIDISGWILDDNNGSFSPANSFTGSGVATGHIRFKNVAPWNRLPVGALILIYNSADKDAAITAADDLTDANMDCVYIVPSNSITLEYSSTVPIANTCASATVSYAGATYVTPPVWGSIGMANGGDVISLRDPSSTLVHAIVYGQNSGCSGSDLIGNASAPFIGNTGMSNQFAYYDGTDVAGYTNSANWVRGIYGTNTPTPGAYNNATNQTLIETTIRGGCTCEKILDLFLMNFFANKQNKTVKLDWQIRSRMNVNSVDIERSSDGSTFYSIGSLNAIGQSNQSWIDQLPFSRNYYRLKLHLPDGNIHYSRTIPVMFDNDRADAFSLSPNPFSDLLVLQKNNSKAYDVTLVLSDIAGKKLYQQNIRMGTRDQVKYIPAGNLPQGIIVATIYSQTGNSDMNTTVIKLLHQ